MDDPHHLAVQLAVGLEPQKTPARGIGVGTGLGWRNLHGCGRAGHQRQGGLLLPGLMHMAKHHTLHLGEILEQSQKLLRAPSGRWDPCVGNQWRRVGGEGPPGRGLDESAVSAQASPVAQWRDDRPCSQPCGSPGRSPASCPRPPHRAQPRHGAPGNFSAIGVDHDSPP